MRIARVFTNENHNLLFKNSSPGLEIGELLVHHLEALGIEFVFGVPGGAVEPLFNAMARSERRGGLRAIGCRHETGAAYIAQGYGKETDTIGVCVATTGPGASNLVTGVASAYLDEEPLLVITGLNTASSNGRAAFQDSSKGGVDTVALFDSCTRYNTVISSPEHVERELYAALTIALGEQPGPVHLAIPVDIMSADSGVISPKLAMPLRENYSHLGNCNNINALWALIKDSRKFAIVIGESCQAGIQEILHFAELMQVNFVCLPSAKGFIDPRHPLFRGVFGFAGHFHARETLIDPELDFVMVLGSALSEWDTAKWDRDAIFNSRLVHVDPVLSHHAFTPMAKLHLRGNIKTILLSLTRKVTMEGRSGSSFNYESGLPLQPDSGSQKYPPQYPTVTRKTNKIHPGELMKVLGDITPHSSRFFIDAGNSMSWGIHYLNPRYSDDHRDRCWFHISMRFAAMGWGIGNAIGAAMGNRNALTFCITGDGSYLMNGQEFTVAIEEQLPIIFVLLNDSSLGMVKHGQRMVMAESVANTLPKINFAEMAQAMGANGIRCSHLDEVMKIDFASILRNKRPTLIDIIIDEEAVPPMHTQVRNPYGVSYA